MSSQIADAASEWLTETALLEVGEAELAEMERIFHALRDAGAPAELVHEFDRTPARTRRAWLCRLSTRASSWPRIR